MSALVLPAPPFFYGTAWKEDRTSRLTSQALAAGFRAIDTANQRRHYVEAAVGDAIADWLGKSGRERSELFLQSKFTYARGQDQRLPYDPKSALEAQVLQSFESSLEHLQTTYLDSYLLHGPSNAKGISDDDWEVWGAMEALQRAGRTRVLGVSNVSLEQLTLLVDRATVAPAFVQNRCYASTGWDRDIRAFCQSHGIGYQAFSLLTANGRELQGAAVAGAVRRTGRTPAQVVFRFALRVGMIPLTGTSSTAHLEQDLECLGFELEPAEVEAIERSSRA